MERKTSRTMVFRLVIAVLLATLTLGEPNATIPAKLTLARDTCERQGSFYCLLSDLCVALRHRCDGYVFCSYGEDEAGCITSSNAPTSPAPLPPYDSCIRQDRYFCGISQSCIPKPWRCDGITDCLYREDEIDCTPNPFISTTTTATRTSSPRDACYNRGRFYCDNSGDCIEQWRRCDGYSNCQYGEDESECGTTSAPAYRPESSSVSCGNSLYGSAIIVSPNYPQPYPNNAACTWYLQSYPSGSNLVVQFQSFDTEANSDVVRVYDESSTAYSFSGSALPPKMVLGKSGKITFRSNSSTKSAKGFYITISSIDLKRSSAIKLNRGCMVVAASYLASSIMSHYYFNAY